MMYYYKEKDYWYFAGLDKEALLRLKFISSYKRNSANKELYIKSDPAKEILLKEFVSDCGIEEVDPLSIVRTGCKAEIKPFKELLSRKDIELLIDNLPLLKKPRSYQMDYLYYAVNHGNHINGSSVGTGKSLCSVLYAEMLDLFPCMVVCPASVKSGWLREWKETNPNRRVSIISTSSPPEDFEADVIVINYDILGKRVTKENGKTSLEIRLDGMKKKSFSLVIADEIHFLKNRKSIRSKSFKKLIHKVPSVIGLTGTLIMNRPAELLNILMLIERIKEIAPDDQYHHYFFERYCNMKETNFGMDISGASNTKELNRLLKECCYFQVSKRDALKELPPISENVVECEITNKRAYKKAKDDLLQFIEDKFKDEEKVEKAARAEFLVKLSTLKQLSLEGKEKFIKKWVEEWMEANEEEKLLVFASQSTILTKIAEEFKEGLLITGGTTTKKRDEILQKFFSQKESRVLFANIGCLGTGVDGLQKACFNMAILELPPRPSDLVQVIGRLERSGQENPVTIQYLLSPETIDQDLWEMLKGKKDVTDMLNKGFQDDTSLMILQKYKNER
nr:MAG TPA: Chromatin remodeling complex ATPase [Caudoviricetes sp.]